MQTLQQYALTLNNMTNTLQRWLKMSGIAVAGEKRQQSLAKELVGENIAAEPVAMSFSLPSGGEELRSPDLKAKITQILD